MEETRSCSQIQTAHTLRCWVTKESFSESHVGVIFCSTMLLMWPRRLKTFLSSFMKPNLQMPNNCNQTCPIEVCNIKLQDFSRKSFSKFLKQTPKAHTSMETHLTMHKHLWSDQYYLQFLQLLLTTLTIMSGDIVFLFEREQEFH